MARKLKDNTVIATVTLEGTTALLWNAFGPDTMPLEKRERSGIAGRDPEEWRRSVLATADGQLYFKPASVFGTARDGARHIKISRRSIQPLVVATLQVVEAVVLTDRWLPGFPNGSPCDLRTVPVPDSDPGLPVYLDMRPGRNPSTKGMNIRYRVAAAPGWTATFHLRWDKTIVSREEMESVLLMAGKLEGIGDGRKIGLGRFELTGFNAPNGE